MDNATVWATAVSTHAESGRRIIWRFISRFTPDFQPELLPDRVIIAWRYESETGQPVKSEHEQMVRLEELLEPIEESGKFATLALVSTGEGLREWTYQAKSGDDFVDRLNLALKLEPAFPIEIHVAADPTWSMYKKFRAGVTDSTT